MATRNKNLLDLCNDRGMAPQEFMHTFCRRCRNKECVNATWGLGRFDIRMMTQEDRLLINPNLVNDERPEFEHIQTMNFGNLLQKAMKLEISSQKNDWTIPDVPEVGLGDERGTAAEEKTTSAVDDAVKQLAKLQGKPEPELPQVMNETERMMLEFADEAEEQPDHFVPAGEVEGMPPPPPQQIPPAPDTPKAVPRPTNPSPPNHEFAANTPIPEEGVMLDGSTPPSTPVTAPKPKEHAAVASWGEPKPKETIPVGATIRMGAPEPEEEEK